MQCREQLYTQQQRRHARQPRTLRRRVADADALDWSAV
jgi:hypothetical protein